MCCVFVYLFVCFVCSFDFRSLINSSAGLSRLFVSILFFDLSSVEFFGIKIVVIFIQRDQKCWNLLYKSGILFPLFFPFLKASLFNRWRARLLPRSRRWWLLAVIKIFGTTISRQATYLIRKFRFIGSMKISLLSISLFGSRKIRQMLGSRGWK